MQKLKYSVEIDADVPTCYHYWADYHQMVRHIHRIIKVWDEILPQVTPIASFEHLNEKGKASLTALQEKVPLNKIRHFLTQGPDGKTYEVENAIVMEIPDLFYSWTSTDLMDLSVQSSVSFLKQEDNGKTLMFFECSFCIPTQQAMKGKSSQLISDIVKTQDPFIPDVLTDFKAYVENQGQYSPTVVNPSIKSIHPLP